VYLLCTSDPVFYSPKLPLSQSRFARISIRLYARHEFANREKGMLTVYTRHLKGCEHRQDSRRRRCHCPKWIRGLLPTGEKIRRTAQTSNWEKAEKLARKLEADVDPNKPVESKPVELTIRETVSEFLAIRVPADWRRNRSRNIALFSNGNS
jgi:hypothetical protein